MPNPNKLTTKEFLKKVEKVHNNKYDYNLVNYQGSFQKIKIICKIHGIFEQIAYLHVKGSGCSKCAIIDRAEKHKGKQKYNQQSILERFEKTHNKVYDYSNVIFVSLRQKVKIICNTHGEFMQKPMSHLQGQGCPICKGVNHTIAMKSNTEDFIKKAKEIHKGFYIYDKTIYGRNNQEKVIITCPIHGDFKQSPNSHINQKSICKKCNFEYNPFTRSSWVERAKNRQGVFYIIRCWNDEEDFYKLGITFVSTKRRYHTKQSMPYNYKIIKEVISENLAYIWDLEKRFKRIKIKQHYIPLIKFGGSKYECFKN